MFCKECYGKCTIIKLASQYSALKSTHDIKDITKLVVENTTKENKNTSATKQKLLVLQIKNLYLSTISSLKWKALVACIKEIDNDEKGEEWKNIEYALASVKWLSTASFAMNLNYFLDSNNHLIFQMHWYCIKDCVYQ